MKIIKANKKHLFQIFNLAKNFGIENFPQEELQNKGFLVSGFSAEDYTEFINTTEHFYLYFDNKKLAGFILAYNRQQIKPDEWLNNEIKNREKEGFVLVKQIVVDDAWQGKGIARQLYEYLFTRMNENVCYAVIVTEPVNLRSINFHTKLGFEKVFDALPPDALKRGVWRKILK